MRGRGFGFFFLVKISTISNSRDLLKSVLPLVAPSVSSSSSLRLPPLFVRPHPRSSLCFPSVRSLLNPARKRSISLTIHWLGLRCVFAPKGVFFSSQIHSNCSNRKYCLIHSNCSNPTPKKISVLIIFLSQVHFNRSN